MKISEKTCSLFRYMIAFTLIFGTVTLNESSKAVDAPSPNETFEGKSIRCVIDMDDDNGTSGMKTGFSYELLKNFADAVGADIQISAAGRKTDYIDSLKTGKVDIVIIPDTDTIQDKDIILSLCLDNSVWAVNSKDIAKVKELNTWIATYSKSAEYDKLWNKYHRTSNPFSKLAKGAVSSKISPYDRVIREYAAKLGWDWRMLAAVIYQESKFSINTVSHRGATGLMQVMPSTAEYYGVHDLLDPEENIKAGTMHLARLQKMYSGMDSEERVKFVLASYNAGEGRIADCRNLAAARELDNSRWEDILKVIPSMREDSILNEKCVKFGKFNGTETIHYVDNVLSIYSAFCEICPA